jgi:hypothetical protein
MRQVHRWLAAVPALVLFGACAERASFHLDPDPETITILPGTALTVRSGDLVPLTVIVVDNNGDFMPGEPVHFSGTNAAVATVSSDYVITALEPGTTVLTARSGGASARLTVEVLTWPRTPVSGGAFGAAAHGGTGLVTTLDFQVLRLDATTGAVLATYNFGSSYAAFNDDGARAFFANTVFDLASETELHPILTDQSGVCGDLYAALERPGGAVTFLGCSGGVLAVNSGSGTLINNVPTAYPVNDLAMHPTNQRVYAAIPSAGQVYEISTQSNELVRSLTIPGGPQALVVPGGTELYVSLEGKLQVQKWDLAGPTLVDSLPLRSVPNAGPFDLVQSADGIRLLTSVGSVVVELDRASLSVTRTFWVGGIARRIGVTEGRAIVANEQGWVDLLPF